MTKESFLRKLKLFDRLKDQLDEEVWKRVHKYVEDRHINFNYPENWVVTGMGIEFNGQDGCRGCYDNMSLTIPFKYFEDYDKHTAEELKIKREKEAAEKMRQFHAKEMQE